MGLKEKGDKKMKRIYKEKRTIILFDGDRKACFKYYHNNKNKNYIRYIDASFDTRYNDYVVTIEYK